MSHYKAWMDETVCQVSLGWTVFTAAVDWMDLTECLGPPEYPVLTVGTEIREYKATEDRLDLRESVVCPGLVVGRERTGDTERPAHRVSVPGWQRVAALKRRGCCSHHASATVGWVE